MNQFQEFKSRTQAVRGSIHRYKWNTGFAVRRTNMLMLTRESFATGSRVILRVAAWTKYVWTLWRAAATEAETLSYAVAGIGQWNYFEQCEAFHALFYNNNKNLYR